MKLRAIISYMTDFSALFLFIYLLIFPEYASEPTRKALEFCASALMPSLFVYIVLAKITASLPITNKLNRILGCGTVSLIIGTLCGCPIGAKNAVLLYEQGKISKKYAEYLCSFTNNASVSFVVGYVGKELFNDVFIGLRLLVYQIFASVITACVMKFLLFGKEKPLQFTAEAPVKIGLREAITDSVSTMLNLCGCAVFFMVAGGAVTQILKLPKTAEAVLKSVLEFSSGCAAAVNCGGFAIAVSAFSIGFTGLSVALQVRNVTAGKLSIRPFLTGKVICCAIMTCLAVVFG